MKNCKLCGFSKLCNDLPVICIVIPYVAIAIILVAVGYLFVTQEILAEAPTSLQENTLSAGADSTVVTRTSWSFDSLLPLHRAK